MKIKSLINNIFLIVIAITLMMLTFNSLWYLLLFIPYLLFIIYKTKHKNMDKIIILSIFVCLSLILINYELMELRYKDENNIDNITGKVINIKEYDNYNIIVIRIGLDKYYIYDKDKVDIKIGYIIKSNITKREIEDKRNKYAFDYKAYLKYEHIKECFDSNGINIEKKSFSLRRIKTYFNNYIDKYISDDISKIIIKGLVLGDTTLFSDTLDEGLKENGIVHLFAVSGLHVSLLVMFITKILMFFNIKEKKINIIVLSFLLIYLFMTGFTSSIIRASLMYFIGLINNKYKKRLTSLDVASISFIILVLFDPYMIYKTGFSLSYLVCFSIILSSELVKKMNNYKQILVLSIISNLVSLPIVINLNNEINILSPIMNVFYITIVSSIVLPFTFVVIIIPILSFAYDIMANVFVYLVNFTANINISLKLPNFSPLTSIVYIILLLALFYFIYDIKKRRIIASIFLLFILLLSNVTYFNNDCYIDFMYLNDGEASIIRLKDKTILIDTGDGNNNELYSYLASSGIKRIDYCFITHSHNDHNGGIEYINNHIKVKNIIISEYDYSNYRYFDNVSIIYENKILDIYGYKFHIITPTNRSDDENDNSLVIYLEDFKILFMGDVSSKQDERIISYLNGYEVNTIKIAHHGSNTSTSNDLIKELKVNDAIIMVGKRWKDKFPSDSVINILNKYDVIVYDTLSLKSFRYHLK